MKHEDIENANLQILDRSGTRPSAKSTFWDMHGVLWQTNGVWEVLKHANFWDLIYLRQ